MSAHVGSPHSRPADNEEASCHTQGRREGPRSWAGPEGRGEGGAHTLGPDSAGAGAHFLLETRAATGGCGCRREGRTESPRQGWGALPAHGGHTQSPSALRPNACPAAQRSNLARMRKEEGKGGRGSGSPHQDQRRGSGGSANHGGTGVRRGKAGVDGPGRGSGPPLLSVLTSHCWPAA